MGKAILANRLISGSSNRIGLKNDAVKDVNAIPATFTKANKDHLEGF